MPKLRSTYDGRLIYETSYDYRKIKLFKILQSTISCPEIISHQTKTEKVDYFVIVSVLNYSKEKS